MTSPQSAKTPSLASPSPERRRKRSLDPLVALHYQLASARRDGNLEALVVAEGSGIVVAASGAWAVCEKLAAYAPLFPLGPSRESDLASELGLDDDSAFADLLARAAVTPVNVDGQTVLLCGLGDAGGASGATMRPAIDRAAGGVARILGRGASPSC